MSYVRNEDVLKKNRIVKNFQVLESPYLIQDKEVSNFVHSESLERIRRQIEEVSFLEGYEQARREYERQCGIESDVDARDLERMNRRLSELKDGLWHVLAAAKMMHS